MSYNLIESGLCGSNNIPSPAQNRDLCQDASHDRHSLVICLMPAWNMTRR